MSTAFRNLVCWVINVEQHPWKATTHQLSTMTTTSPDGSGFDAVEIERRSGNLNLAVVQTFPEYNSTSATYSESAIKHFNCDAWSEPSRAVLQV